MARIVRAHWPLIVAWLGLWLFIADVVAYSLGQNGGCLVYALDDAYIHMAIAKNCAQSGVWGVTRHAFSNSSSSPLWTLMLAGIYRAFGVNEVAPLALNLAFASALMWVMYGLLRKWASALPIPDPPHRRWPLGRLLLVVCGAAAVLVAAVLSPESARTHLSADRQITSDGAHMLRQLRFVCALLGMVLCVAHVQERRKREDNSEALLYVLAREEVEWP